MNAEIRELHDAKGTTIYPVTSAKSVYLPNGTDTVERYIEDTRDADTEISFFAGKITKKMASGSVTTTSFDGNVITEVTKDKNGQTVSTKTTTFNDDGTIKIEVK